MNKLYIFVNVTKVSIKLWWRFCFVGEPRNHNEVFRLFELWWVRSSLKIIQIIMLHVLTLSDTGFFELQKQEGLFGPPNPNFCSTAAVMFKPGQ